MKFTNEKLSDLLKNSYFEDKVYGRREEKIKEEDGKKVLEIKTVKDDALVTAVFDKCDRVIDMNKFIANSIDESETASISDINYWSEDAQEAAEKFSAVVEYYSDIFRNKGVSSYDPSRDKMKPSDFFKEIGSLGKIMDKHAMGGLLSVMTQVFQYTSTEILPTEPSIHQYIAQKFDIKPGAIVKFPFLQANAPGGLFYASEQDLKTTSLGSDETFAARRDQVGIKVYLSYEEIENSESFDLIALHFMVARNALVNFKTQILISTLMQNGRNVFDNFGAPGDSIYGKTSGLSFKAPHTENDTLTMRNFNKSWRDGFNRGFDLSTVLISPEAYEIFENTPEMRTFIKERGKVLFAKPSSEPGRSDEPFWRKSVTEGSGEYNRVKPNIPAGLTDVQYTFIVTRYMPTWYPGEKVWKTYDIHNDEYSYYKDGSGNDRVVVGSNPYTSICMLDPKQALIYIESDPEFMDKRDDWEKHYTAKFMEKYNFHVLRNGQGISWIRNVMISDERTLDLDTVQFTSELTI